MNNNEQALVALAYKRGYRRNWLAGLAVVSATLLAGGAVAQEESSKALSERSSIIVVGKVMRVNASLEPLQAASDKTLVITISRMYAGAEIAGDQSGRTATVILRGTSAKFTPGTEAMFFGNPRFVGNSLTIASEGELPVNAAALASADSKLGARGRLDQSLRERLVTASSVFHGKVESERALTAGAEQLSKSQEASSEHDPEWHVASVRVVTALQGGAKAGTLVNVIFPASRDIVWFNSPKLRQGQEDIFITHKPDKDDTRLMRAPGVAAFLEKQSAELVTHPFDVAPALDEERVRSLLAKGK